MSLRPTPAVAAVILDDDDRVLQLIQRGRPPSVGGWTLPGGRIEPGETMREALVREVREETGLDVVVEDLVFAADAIDPDGAWHYVIVDFRARVIGGTLRPGDDASDARWVSAAALARTPLIGRTGEAIAAARASRPLLP